MQIKSSRTLLHFYKEWQKWVDAGAPQGENEQFRRNEGLCIALEGFIDQSDDELWEYVTEELKNQFKTAGLHKYYPFGEESYVIHAAEFSQHKQVLRLEWVRNRILDGEINCEN